MLKEVFEEGLYEELQKKDPERLREIESWDPVLVVRDWGYIVGAITDVLMCFVAVYLGSLLLKWGDIFRGYGSIVASVIIFFYSIKKAINFQNKAPVIILLKEGNFIYYSKNYKKDLPFNCYGICSKFDFVDILFVRPLEVLKIWKNVSQKKAPTMWFILFPMIAFILSFVAILRTFSIVFCKMLFNNRNGFPFYLFFFNISTKETLANMDWESVVGIGAPRIIFLNKTQKEILLKYAKNVCEIIL